MRYWLGRTEGTKKDDTLTGGKSDDWVLGFAGKDKLKGGKGDDMLQGGDGRDVLSGSKGDDYLDGSKGSDVLSGGEGLDVFKISKGIDIVEDFSIDDGDRIALDKKGKYRIIEDSAGVLIKASRKKQVLLQDADFDEIIAEGVQLFVQPL